MFSRYREICDRGELQPGRLWLWQGVDHWVLNFPTKLHWRQPSRIEWIEQGLRKFVDQYEALKIREISFPRLGCGNGNLDWDDVRPMMEHYLKMVRVPVYIHDFEKDIGVPEHLEQIANQAASLIPSGIEFDDFICGLRTISSIAGDRLVELTSHKSFCAHVDDLQNLRIEEGGKVWEFDAEDLHGAWVSLLRGLVTRERVEWSQGDGGDFVITLLSLLPNARAVEIQRNDKPEIAVELRPSARQVSSTSPAREQLKLQWH